MVDLTKPVAVMCFSGSAGGMERSAVRLARFLSSITTVVLVCKKDSFTEKLYKEEGSDQYACETVDFSSRIFSPAMLFRVRAIASDCNIGNVVFLGASELKTLFFSFIGLKINLIVWHGTTKSKPKRDFLHQLVYSSVHHHVALSEHLIRNVKTIVPESKGVKYKVIRPSFDFQVNLNNQSIKDDGVIRILHVGRIASGKGQVDAVHACKYLKDKGVNFHLTIIGGSDGSNYVNEVKKTIVDLMMEEFVTVEGYVEDVTLYLETADVFLFPSRGEGMPNAFIEALHYDMVCVVYDNTVFPEFADMGFYIHLARDGDIADLSDKLLLAVSSLQSEKEKSFNNTVLSGKYFQVGRELREWRDILI